MSLSVNAKTYNADSFEKNSVGYTGAAHTTSVKDYVKLSRVQPKKTSLSSGVGRTSAKLTRTLTLTGALEPTRDAIGEFAMALPVGYASADVDTFLNDMGAFVASAAFKTHVKSQLVSF
jgi:hypothetical protein